MPNIIPNYIQQDATFPDLFISTDALDVSGGSSAHHQEHITVQTASGIVNQYCCLLLPWMGWNWNSYIPSTIAASSNIGWQYLKLYVQLCAPDDGRRNHLNMQNACRNKWIKKRCILLAVIWNYIHDARAYECQIFMPHYYQFFSRRLWEQYLLAPRRRYVPSDSWRTVRCAEWGC